MLLKLNDIILLFHFQIQTFCVFLSRIWIATGPGSLLSSSQLVDFALVNYCSHSVSPPHLVPRTGPVVPSASARSGLCHGVAAPACSAVAGTATAPVLAPAARPPRRAGGGGRAAFDSRPGHPHSGGGHVLATAKRRHLQTKCKGGRRQLPAAQVYRFTLSGQTGC